MKITICGIKKRKSGEQPIVFLYCTPVEACALAASLMRQFVSGNQNTDRSEWQAKLDGDFTGSTYFSAAVEDCEVLREYKGVLQKLEQIKMDRESLEQYRKLVHQEMETVARKRAKKRG